MHATHSTKMTVEACNNAAHALIAAYKETYTNPTAELEKLLDTLTQARMGMCTAWDSDGNIDEEHCTRVQQSALYCNLLEIANAIDEYSR